MLNNSEYIRLSLENNLFWARIMKEHATFIESSMPALHRQLSSQADMFKQQFSRLLLETIRLSNGSISQGSIQSGQYYTRYTEAAEQTTQKLTGIDINSKITEMEYDIQPSGAYASQPSVQSVSTLNQKLLGQVNAFARFKTNLFESQASCRLFTFLYTSIYEHIFHEAQRYMEILAKLQEKDENYNKNFESFWNNQMGDHIKVMRGLFDPTETTYFNDADSLAKTFDVIEKSEAPNKTQEYDATKALSDFKAHTTEKILQCKVKSLMSPLFTDHILREANHYLYLLKL